MFAPLGRRIAGQLVRRTRRNGWTYCRRNSALIYGHTGKLALGFLVHLVGWIGTGARRLDRLPRAGRADRLRRRAGDRGTAERRRRAGLPGPGQCRRAGGGYAGLGAIFGVPPELSLGVSLIRRGRDIAVGVPILLIWQFVEMRRLRARQRVTDAGSFRPH